MDPPPHNLKFPVSLGDGNSGSPSPICAPSAGYLGLAKKKEPSGNILYNRRILFPYFLRSTNICVLLIQVTGSC